MNSFSMVRPVRGPLYLLVAAGALAVLFSVTPALAADMDAKPKALAKSMRLVKGGGDEGCGPRGVILCRGCDRLSAE